MCSIFSVKLDMPTFFNENLRIVDVYKNGSICSIFIEVIKKYLCFFESRILRMRENTKDKWKQRTYQVHVG